MSDEVVPYCHCVDGDNDPGPLGSLTSIQILITISLELISTLKTCQLDTNAR